MQQEFQSLIKSQASYLPFHLANFVGIPLSLLLLVEMDWFQFGVKILINSLLQRDIFCVSSHGYGVLLLGGVVLYPCSRLDHGSTRRSSDGFDDFIWVLEGKGISWFVALTCSRVEYVCRSPSQFGLSENRPTKVHLLTIKTTQKKCRSCNYFSAIHLSKLACCHQNEKK